jgi:hypothetical protein
MELERGEFDGIYNENENITCLEQKLIKKNNRSLYI